MRRSLERVLLTAALALAALAPVACEPPKSDADVSPDVPDTPGHDADDPDPDDPDVPGHDADPHGEDAPHGHDGEEPVDVPHGGPDHTHETGDATGDAAVPVPDCETFCHEVDHACEGANAQWPDDGACEADCALWPVGEPGALLGNSLACRATHLAEIAEGAEDPESHCDHVGPSGDALCGSLCDAYCWYARKNCTGARALYGTEAECRGACDGFPTGGIWDELAGDSVQCRLAHAKRAADDPAVHCPHAATASAACD